MGNRISAATERALALVLSGVSPYSAAIAEGIAYQTIQRAMLRELGLQHAPESGTAAAYRATMSQRQAQSG